MEVAVGQQWGIFSRKVQRWAVATVISVENGTVNHSKRLPHAHGTVNFALSVGDEVPSLRLK
jgi:hypothetical protein